MLTSCDVAPFGGLTSAAMALQLLHRAHQSLVRLFAQIRHAAEDGFVGEGYHNTTRIRELRLPLALLLGKWPVSLLGVFRTPKRDAIESIPRIWPREAEVLRAVNSRLPDVPRCLVDTGPWTLSSYVPGRLLEKEVPKGGTYGTPLMSKLADVFAALADVSKDELPQLPAYWPRDWDSQGFLRCQVQFTNDAVYGANLARFGALFDAVGVPEDAAERFLAITPGLTPRPFSLLHTDVHPGNIVLSPRKDGTRPVVIDWESAMYGDPLHDLATHLVRMGYIDAERDAMINEWLRAMRPRHPEATEGLEKDLPVYLAFEHVQSVFPDVMRAALKLPTRPTDQDFAVAADKVCRAVRLAREALDLGESPADLPTVGAALRQWHESERRVAHACGQGEEGRGWKDLRKSGRRVGGAVSVRLGGVVTASLTWTVVTPW
jgi:aminoglycoside phosphotransferase (APT) family kinase protein